MQDAGQRMDVLVNCAGVCEPWVPLHKSDPATWWHTFEVNVRGIYAMTHAMLPSMLALPHGAVVINVASVGGLRPEWPGGSSYGPSKTAVIRQACTGSWGLCAVRLLQP